MLLIVSKHAVKEKGKYFFRRTSACDALMTKCMGYHSWPYSLFHQVLILIKQGKLSFSQKLLQDSLFFFHQACWPLPLSAASALENPLRPLLQTQMSR